ncbi:MAG: YceI family protein [Geothrix sp.]|nr:YceI family protein [Geothrix sp.]
MHHTLKTLALGAALFAAPMLAQAQSAPPINANPAAVQAGAYNVEPTHTRVLLAVSHMGFTTWYSQFTNVSGTLTLDPKDVSATTLDITIPTNTISTTNTKLDGELNSPAWLDTAKYPTIEFKSTKVVRTGHDTAKVTGELTFHGVTLPETLNVTFNASGVNFLSKQYTVGFNATGMIKRSDFNVKTYVPVIGDDVSLIISAAFVKP